MGAGWPGTRPVRPSGAECAAGKARLLDPDRFGVADRRRLGQGEGLPTMLKFLSLLLFSVTAASAQMQVLDFGARGKVTLYLPGEWKAATTDMAGTYAVTLTPAGESVNASCQISVTFPETDRFDTKARLKLRVEADGYALAEQSVERKAYAQELKVGSGYGYYCNFTDPSLQGKPPEKGNHKVTTLGKVRVDAAVLLEFQILSDGFGTEPHQQLLGALEGLEFAPGRGR